MEHPLVNYYHCIWRMCHLSSLRRDPVQLYYQFGLASSVPRILGISKIQIAARTWSMQLMPSNEGEWMFRLRPSPGISAANAPYTPEPQRVLSPDSAPPAESSLSIRLKNLSQRGKGKMRTSSGWICYLPRDACHPTTWRHWHPVSLRS